MRIHYLQHVWFEDVGLIAQWAHQHGHTITRTALYDGETLPAIDDVDFLIVMGGPMSIYEEERYPWLVSEKKYIETAIKAHKHVLGICLGAQLISDVLGGKVYKNEYKEIGWFPLQLTDAGKQSILFRGFNDEFTAFHWHGDTFQMADGCLWLAKTNACNIQAFVYGQHVVGFQFHLEMTHAGIERIVKECNQELKEGAYVSNAQAIKGGCIHVEDTNRLMSLFLNNMINTEQEC